MADLGYAGTAALVVVPALTYGGSQATVNASSLVYSGTEAVINAKKLTYAGTAVYSEPLPLVMPYDYKANAGKPLAMSRYPVHLVRAWLASH